MIIDTSALVAILRDEPDAKDCARAIESAAKRRPWAVNFVEAAVVIDGSRDPIASRRFDDLLREAQVLIEPVIEIQARLARDVSRFRQRQRTSGLYRSPGAVRHQIPSNPRK
jgi:ribonuclease VapC